LRSPIGRKLTACHHLRVFASQAQCDCDTGYASSASIFGTGQAALIAKSGPQGKIKRI
jgi:hypothetical protein